MHMVYAPPANRMKPSFADNPRKTSSPAVNAYLQHLQSKNVPDPRQTIAAPIVRNSSKSSSSQSNVPSTKTSGTSFSSSTAPLPSQLQHPTDSRERSAVDVANEMPTKSVVNPHSTTHHEKRKPRHHHSKDKPPLGHKHPRSIISILTNTTYLSSDSEEDDTSTATATVHSDGTSLGSISRRRRYRRSAGDDSRSSGTSPSFPTHPEEANQGALIPFQPRTAADDVDATDHRRNHLPYYNSNYTTNSHSYDEEDNHVEQEAFSYSSGDEEDDDTLNQLIEETSARWKMAVHETVQSTATSAAFSSSQQMMSSVLQMQYASPSSEMRPVVHSPSSGDLSNRTASNDDGFPAAAAPFNPSSQLIQEQQAEIEALRAALQRHQQPAAGQSHPPVHPIQILTVPPGPDPHGIEDDLTVWSGFHSTAPPPLQQQRPDAESNDASKSSGTQKLNHTRVAPPRLPPAVQTSLRLELSSTVTGLHRSAMFTGTISSKQPPFPSDASFTTIANHSVTGTGVLQFLETGDVYRGDLVHSEMHGFGTYTFAKNNTSPKVLSGRFEHNVYLGE